MSRSCTMPPSSRTEPEQTSGGADIRAARRGCWIPRCSRRCAGQQPAIRSRLERVADTHIHALVDIFRRGSMAAVIDCVISLLGKPIAEYALAVDNELVPVEGYRSANSGIALAVCPELRCACLTGHPWRSVSFRGSWFCGCRAVGRGAGMAVCGGEAVRGDRRRLAGLVPGRVTGERAENRRDAPPWMPWG